MTDATTISVGGEAPYDVLVGHGLHGRLPALLGGALRVAVVHPPTLTAQVGELATELIAAGHRVELIAVPDGEDAKTAAVLADGWSALGRAGFTRTDAVVGFGGGAVTDFAGFLAASWLRGVAVVQVPTTLLGMVDAAIGGKTGINTAEGKNLVGAFHPPRGVLCDLDALGTLPADELVPGMAEVIKCGFIADPAILDLIEVGPAAALNPTGAVLRELVERTVAVKAEVVGADLRESGRREILNYGHTLGHAVERAEGYRWRHGNAVSVGMIFAAELAHRSGRIDAALLARHRAVAESVGLPISYRGDLDALLATMRIDKKARADRLRFIVLGGLARPEVFEAPSDALIRDAFAALST